MILTTKLFISPTRIGFKYPFIATKYIRSNIITFVHLPISYFLLSLLISTTVSVYSINFSSISPNL
jgi:hypothetical protein